MTPEVARQRAIFPALAILAGVGAGIFIIVTRGNIGAGIAFIFAGIVIATIIAVLRDPPPPNEGNKDAGAINFGG